MQHSEVQIFVEHWGGDNLQFYPNFALFSKLGWMNLSHDFFSGEQMKWRPKKRSSPKPEHHQKQNNFYSANSWGNLRSEAHQSQIIGGDGEKGHTQIIGGYKVQLMGDIPPHPPR